MRLRSDLLGKSQRKSFFFSIFSVFFKLILEITHLRSDLLGKFQRKSFFFSGFFGFLQINIRNYASPFGSLGKISTQIGYFRFSSN